MGDNAVLLDSNEQGEQLYELSYDFAVSGKTAILITADGSEYSLTDWQSGDYPKTLAGADQYDWLPLADILNWHD